MEQHDATVTMSIYGLRLIFLILAAVAIEDMITSCSYPNPSKSCRGFSVIVSWMAAWSWDGWMVVLLFFLLCFLYYQAAAKAAEAAEAEEAPKAARGRKTRPFVQIRPRFVMRRALPLWT